MLLDFCELDIDEIDIDTVLLIVAYQKYIRLQQCIMVLSFQIVLRNIIVTVIF